VSVSFGIGILFGWCGVVCRHHHNPTVALRPVGQDPEALLSVRNGRTTALFGFECKSFLDSLIDALDAGHQQRIPSSADLIPNEQSYSKFKQFLRKVAARNVPALNRAIRSFIPQLNAQECANYFKHAGYASI
jgi:hypothetical protein